MDAADGSVTVSAAAGAASAATASVTTAGTGPVAGVTGVSGVDGVDGNSGDAGPETAGGTCGWPVFAAAAESANDSKILMIGLSAVLTMILR